MNTNKGVIFNTIFFLFFLMTTSCGSSKKDLDLNYRNSGKIQNFKIQYIDKIALDMGGQPMEADKEYEIIYSEKASSNSNQQDIQSTITLEKVSASIIMSQQRQVIGTGNIEGKEIEMIRSLKGDSITFKGANDIPKINMSMMAGGPVGIDFFLKSYSPIFPFETIKKGDTWTAQSTRNQLAGSLPVSGLIETTYRLISFEKVSGYECVKIESRSAGKLSGEAEQMGMYWTHKGIFESEAIWYFAFKEGLLVKASITEHTKGTLDTAGENAMSVPVEHNTIVELGLLTD